MLCSSMLYGYLFFSLVSSCFTCSKRFTLELLCAGDARYKDPAKHPSPRGHSPANWFGRFEHVYKSLVWHNARDISTAFRSHFEYSVQASLSLAAPADKPEKAKKDLSNVSTRCLRRCFRRILFRCVLACFGLACHILS